MQKSSAVITVRQAFALMLAALLALTNFQPRAAAAPGDLDPSFDLDGRVTTDFFGSFDGASAVLVQPDGKLVAVGSAQGGGEFALARYDSGGTLDPAFGNGGRVATAFPGSLALAAALQADGKIVVVGRAGGINPTADFGIIRYDTQGNPDPMFGMGGKVTTDFAGNFDAATGVAIQPDGKIVVAGVANGLGANSDFAVARYDASGVLDPAFGMGGKMTLDFFGGNDGGAEVALQPDGKIVLASNVQGPGSLDFGVARLTSGGTPDPAFGMGGKVTTDFAGAADNAAALALQSDGKIVVAGIANGNYAAARYLTNGNPDPGFGNGGKLMTALSGIANDLAVQSDGKLVLAGTATGGNNLDFGVLRLTTNGLPDAGFGNGGVVLTDFLSNDDGCGAVAIQPDGKIIAGGFANNGGSTDFALARYGEAGGACPAITFTPATLPNGVANTAYNATVAASPADNYSYAVTTNILPPGLTLNSATGAITGIPAAGGNFTFVITATNAKGCAGTQAYNLLVTTNCEPITVNPATLPAATIGVAYSQIVSATGGAGPYTFAVTSGALPTGLLLDSATGAISGTPSAGGTFSFRITASSLAGGMGGCSGSRLYVMTLACGAVTLTVPALPNAKKGVMYSKQLAASPAGNYTYSLMTGQLPPGMMLSSAGLISGVSNTPGTYSFKVKAVAGGCLGMKNYTLTVTD